MQMRWEGLVVVMVTCIRLRGECVGDAGTLEAVVTVLTTGQVRLGTSIVLLTTG